MNSSFLNGYISDSFQLVEGDSKTYKIVTYQQEHKEEYTIYEMQNDKENGVVESSGTLGKWRMGSVVDM